VHWCTARPRRAPLDLVGYGDEDEGDAVRRRTPRHEPVRHCSIASLRARRNNKLRLLTAYFASRRPDRGYASLRSPARCPSNTPSRD